MFQNCVKVCIYTLKLSTFGTTIQPWSSNMLVCTCHEQLELQFPDCYLMNLQFANQLTKNINDIAMRNIYIGRNDKSMWLHLKYVIVEKGSEGGPHGFLL